MKREEFEKLVKRALLNLPKNILEKLENIAVCIEKEPAPNQLRKSGTRISKILLGLYQGVPKIVWGRESFSARLPDKITIFQKSIERLAKTKKEIKELVKIVIWHEIAHHFGFSEKEVRELEKKWRKKEKRPSLAKNYGCF